MMLTTDTDEQALDLEEGWICLDFANTGIRGDDIHDVGEVIEWAREIGLVSNEESDELIRKAIEAPAEAERAVAEARRQRKLLRQVFGVIAADDSPADADLKTLNGYLNEAFAQLRLVPTDEGYQLGWTEWTAVDCVLWPVVKSAADLLCSEDLHRIGQCAAADCDWLFLDTSKNRSRRWCSMRRCGNRAKVQRYLERRAS